MIIADIDECALAGCVSAPPTVRECRPTLNVSLIGSGEELEACEGYGSPAVNTFIPAQT